MATRSKPKIATVDEWASANDRGPHVATLPSGKSVRFQLADLSMLLRAGKLPEPLHITAELMASHEQGPNGYAQDLVQSAITRGGDAQATIAKALSTARDLTHYLIAESLVEPEVTPEQVAAGILPELDMKMLVEFATRERNVDAEGNRLPIVVPYEEKWATFRFQRAGDPGAGDGGANGKTTGGDVPAADGGDL